MGSDDEERVELTASGGVEEASPGVVADADESVAKTTSESVKTESGWHEKYYIFMRQKYNLPRHYRLRTEEDTRKYSLWSVNFMILCSAVNTKMLNPNFAIMCVPDAHPDSFDSTEPFGFNSATYFLPLSTLIGVALASTFIGKLSDKHGRKILLLILGWISAAGSIVKYYARDTFWGFCAACFAFGFFLGNLPVGMGYIGDVETNKDKKNVLLGNLVGYFVLGNSGGGIIAVLMADSGLFVPLWVGAALMVIANIGTHIYMIEPGDKRLEPEEVEDKLILDDADDVERPETIDQRTLWNIVGGALLDNIGSTGLFPLCLSPLALEHYYGDFVAAGEDPIMSVNGYQWLSVCVALLVLPSTRMTPYAFKKLGVAGTCVFGNLCTALLTGLLLIIGNLPATELGFAWFVIVMYGGFPFTVFSQLTTGPMLDVIAPEDKIGFVQGLNNSAMNFGMALAPWAFGVLADITSTNIAIGTAIGISVLAALANSPLMWHPQMGRPIPKPPLAQRKLPGEDDELFQKILDGDVVDPEMAWLINRDRGLHNKPAIVPRVKTYDEEKDHLSDIPKGAGDTYRYRIDICDRILAELVKEDSGKETIFNKVELVHLLKTLRGENEPLMEKASSELGQWMGQYLLDNGYSPHTTSVMVKQMFLASFPPLVSAPGNEVDEENVEDYLLKARKVYSRYAKLDEEYTTKKALAANPCYHGTGWW